MVLRLKAVSGFQQPEAASYRLWDLGENVLTSLNLGFLYCKMAGIKTPPLGGCFEN